MARKQTPPLRGPVTVGRTTLPDGWFPRNVMVMADPWHRRAAARQATGDGVIAALADTGVDARGVAMTFAKVVRP
jgi:hypothetical protein